MFYVYVLLSVNYARTYTGSTNNLARRIEEHNKGKVKSSRKFKPFKLIYFEKFSSLTEARRKEGYFKTTSGRRFIKFLVRRYGESAK